MEFGYVIYLGTNYASNRGYPYAELRSLARQAEQAGFDSLWFYDHFIFDIDGQPREGMWEAWTMMSAIAEATERVQLGTLVLCNQMRHPAMLAKMAITLDEVSDGRVILGLGAGWHQAEFDALGLPFDDRVSRLEEAVQIIKPLLRHEQVDFAGSHYRTRNCQILPPGPRTAGPPLMIGASSPRMLRLTARSADIWNVDGCTVPSSIDEPLARMKQACAAVGRDPATLPVTAHVSIAFPELGPLPWWMTDYLSGSDDDIVEVLAAYAERGTAHVMFQCAPTGAESLARLGSIVARYRGSTG